VKSYHSNITRAYLLLALIGLTAQFSLAQWVQQNSGTTSNLTDVVMLDSSVAIAVGRDGSIHRTTNAGATWFDQTAHLSFIRPWNGISFCYASHGIIVGDRAVVTTTDGGANWEAGSFPGTQKCLSALCISPANIYVGGDSGWVYHTLDTGKTWTSEKISTWPIRSLFAWPGPSSIGLPVFALTPYSLCEKLEYTSGPWRETILTNFQGLGSEAFRGAVCNSGGAGFIVGVQGDKRAAPAIIRKSMSDTVWRGVSQNIFRDGTLFGVSAPSANVIYVCGSNGMIFKSTNGGDTWTAATVPSTRTLNAIYFYNERRGFAVGDSGTILYTANGGVTGVGEEPAVPPKEFLLDQNYPNPFNPVTVINYQLAVNSFVTVRVYDLLGREAAMLVNEEKSAGSYMVRWDATHFASGVYFYRLQAGVFSDTKKLLLLK
jgi:photosystem II stability/assembly factor-like uncharacterized protein